MKNFEKCKVCDSEISLINKTYKLVKCNSCGLVFSNKIYTIEEIIGTYDMLYNKTSQYSNHIEEFDTIKNNKKIQIGRPKEFIIKYLLNNNVENICEIGSGVGLVANYLKNKNIEYTGIEIDTPTAEKAKSLGHNIINDSFTYLNNFNSKFDALIGFEVFEHIQEVDDFFKLASNSLKSNGYIGFTVPNYEKIKNYKNVGDNLHQDLPPIHLNFFTKESIKNVLKLYGYEIKILKTKRFPYFNSTKMDTYKFILKALFGKFYGQTIICIAQKNG